MPQDFINQIGVPEFFCETLHSVQQIGPNRRLMFVIHANDGDRQIPMGVVTIVLSADVIADMAQMLAADAQRPPKPAVSVLRLAN
jgi:hypothetical protein